MKRSAFLACAFAAASLPLAVMAQTAPTDWPTKPVTMVVPYPPGGLNDAVARVYAEGKGKLDIFHDIGKTNAKIDRMITDIKNGS